MVERAGRVEGKAAIVTGAGSTPGPGVGTGKACAVVLAREGASVLLVDKKTQWAADPVLVDRRSGRALNERDFVFAAGPAASERTRRRYAMINKKKTLDARQPAKTAGARKRRAS